MQIFFCRRSSFAVLTVLNIKRIKIMPFLTVKHAYVRYNQLSAKKGGGVPMIMSSKQPYGLGYRSSKSFSILSYHFTATMTGET